MPDRVASFSDHAAVLLYVFVSFASYINAWPLFFISSNLPCFQSHFFHSLHCIASQFFLHFNGYYDQKKVISCYTIPFFLSVKFCFIYLKNLDGVDLCLLYQLVYDLYLTIRRDFVDFTNSRPKVKFSLTVQVH